MRTGAAAESTTKPPFDLWYAWSFQVGDPPLPAETTGFEAFATMYGWETGTLAANQGMEFNFLNCSQYAGPMTVILWTSDTANYWDTMWPDVVGATDTSGIPANITLRNNPGNATSLWVQPINGPVAPAGGPYPQQGVTYECLLNPDATTIYVGVARFAGGIPAPGAFTTGLVLTKISASPAFCAASQRVVAKRARSRNRLTQCWTSRPA